MSRSIVVLLLAMVFVVALVASIPARVLSLVLSPDQVVLDGYSGTLWNGRVARCALTTNNGYFQLGTVEWSLSPFSLAMLSPSLNVRSKWGRQAITGQIQFESSRSFVLDNVEASVSARVLQSLLPVTVDGDFSASIVHLKIEAGVPTAGEGRLIWQSASWQSSTGTMPLGSYALDFKRDEPTGLRGSVVTLKGPVEASGSVSLTESSYELDVLLSSAGGLNTQLKQSLSLIAQPVAEGYRIVLQGLLKEMENE